MIPRLVQIRNTIADKYKIFGVMLIFYGIRLGRSHRLARKAQVVHRAEAAMHFLDVTGSQIDLFAGHIKRGMPKNLLQTEYVAAVDQVTHAEGMPAGVRVQFLCMLAAASFTRCTIFSTTYCTFYFPNVAAKQLSVLSPTTTRKSNKSAN